jgi:uncharacterized protein (TIGR00255 family)
MIRSMTGFGQGSVELEGLRLAVELRSVNNRHTDLRFRMPPELAAWESDLRRRVLAQVRRGRVEIGVTVEHLQGGEARPVLNRALLEEVKASRAELDAEYGIRGELDLSAVLALPGLFRMETPEVTWGEEERKALFGALDEALEGLVADRRREGGALKAEIVKRLAAMTGFAGEMRIRAERIPDNVKEKLLQRLNKLSADVELDPARVAQEAAYLADRSDVTEEIVRLEGHLAQVGSLLEEPDGKPVGKRLDFLLQEIHRETNTVCSKSSDLELTRSALALKAEAEKVREQVQNLE